MAENNFTAKVTAELDTSQLEKDLNKLSGKKIKVKADTGKSESDISKVGNAITRAERVHILLEMQSRNHFHLV